MLLGLGAMGPIGPSALLMGGEQKLGCLFSFFRFSIICHLSFDSITFVLITIIENAITCFIILEARINDFTLVL